MTNAQRGGEPLILDGGSLGELHFEWSHDRYAHCWKFGDSPACIRSMESDNHTVWPTSPPLQQIHQQSFGDGRQVIFGVGMAGRGHWSASFTLIPDLKCWIVELACRAPSEPESLQSAYRLDGSWEQSTSNTCVSEVAVGLESKIQLQIEAIQPSSEARLDGDHLTIRPTHIEKAVTTQWALRLRVGG